MCSGVCTIILAPYIGSTFFWFNIDRAVIDLSWQVAHGALRTAVRLVYWGLNVHVFVDQSTKPKHTFFSLAR